MSGPLKPCIDVIHESEQLKDEIRQMLVKRCEELLEKADLRLQVLGEDTMSFERQEDESNVP